MAFTPTFQNAFPTVNASAGVWGGIINARLGEVFTDFTALATQYNITQTVALDALPKAGGTMTGPIALGDPTPNGAADAGYRGAPGNTQDATYTLTVKDAGKTVKHTSGSAHTWTIPPNSAVAIPVDTVILLENTGAGAVTIARGAGVALRINGSSANQDRTLNQYGLASLKKVATDSWIISGPVV